MLHDCNARRNSCPPYVRGLYGDAMSAVGAAVEVARAHGLRSDDPIVLRDAWHVLVHLRPLPLVARVTSGAPGVDPQDVVRELDVARHLQRAGAPVVQPSDLLDPGPHECGGNTLVFWRYLAEDGAARPSRRRSRAPRYPRGAPTTAGPVWHDLETAYRGPREFDLAALVLDDRARDPDPRARTALAAYGPYDDELLEQALPVYAAWVAASFMAAVERRPDAAPALERQLALLRRYR